jgi:hypothetical protein
MTKAVWRIKGFNKIIKQNGEIIKISIESTQFIRLLTPERGDI